MYKFSPILKKSRLTRAISTNDHIRNRLQSVENVRRAHEIPKFSRSTMNATGVSVKIYDEEVCVYEHEAIQFNENDLRTLLQHLRDVQSKVNVFLTTLIQQRDAISGEQSNSITETTKMSN